MHINGNIDDDDDAPNGDDETHTHIHTHDDGGCDSVWLSTSRVDATIGVCLSILLVTVSINVHAPFIAVTTKRTDIQPRCYRLCMHHRQSYHYAVCLSLFPPPTSTLPFVGYRWCMCTSFSSSSSSLTTLPLVCVRVIIIVIDNTTVGVCLRVCLCHHHHYLCLHVVITTVTFK